MSRRGRPPHPDILTPREWQVLALLREGLSDEAIAGRLGLSIHGAKYHVREILSKLGLSSRQEAAAWQREERAPARRLLALPLAARIAAAMVVVAAVAGLALLAWGVVRTDSESDSAGTSEVRVFDCPPGAECPPTPVWEPSGEYHDPHNGVDFAVLWFTVRPEGMTVVYNLTSSDPDRPTLPGTLAVFDDKGQQYNVLGNSTLAPALGVTLGTVVLDRLPDSGQILTLAVSGVTAPSADGEIYTSDIQWAVTFARNVDPDHPCCYTEGLRIAPETFRAYDATLAVASPQALDAFLRVSRGDLATSFYLD